MIAAAVNAHEEGFHCRSSCFNFGIIWRIWGYLEALGSAARGSLAWDFAPTLASAAALTWASEVAFASIAPWASAADFKRELPQTHASQCKPNNQAAIKHAGAMHHGIHANQTSKHATWKGGSGGSSSKSNYKRTPCCFNSSRISLFDGWGLGFQV
jgi:hypothetical protein